MIELFRLYWPLWLTVMIGVPVFAAVGLFIIFKWRARRQQVKDGATIRRILDQDDVDRIRGRVRGNR